MDSYEPDIDLENEWKVLLPALAVLVIGAIMTVAAAYALFLQVLRLLGI